MSKLTGLPDELVAAACSVLPEGEGASPVMLEYPCFWTNSIILSSGKALKTPAVPPVAAFAASAFNVRTSRSRLLTSRRNCVCLADATCTTKPTDDTAGRKCDHSNQENDCRHLVPRPFPYFALSFNSRAISRRSSTGRVPRNHTATQKKAARLRERPISPR